MTTFILEKTLIANDLLNGTQQSDKLQTVCPDYVKKHKEDCSYINKYLYKLPNDNDWGLSITDGVCNDSCIGVTGAVPEQFNQVVVYTPSNPLHKDEGLPENLDRLGSVRSNWKNSYDKKNINGIVHKGGGTNPQLENNITQRTLVITIKINETIGLENFYIVTNLITFLHDIQKNTTSYFKIKGTNPIPELQKIVTDSLVDYYETNGLNAYQNQLFYSFWTDKDNWRYTYPLLPKDANNKIFVQKDAEQIVSGENAQCINYYYDFKKNRNQPATICSKYMSLNDPKLRDVAMTFMEFYKETYPSQYDTYLHSFCNNSNNTLLSECNCVRRLEYPHFIQSLNDFYRYGTYIPKGKTKKASLPASCWYPDCIINGNWVDTSAMPQEGSCGTITYCKKNINIYRDCGKGRTCDTTQVPPVCVACNDPDNCANKPCFDNTIINSTMNEFQSNCPCKSKEECPGDQQCSNGKCVDCILTCSDPTKVCVDGFCKECDRNGKNPCPEGKLCSSINTCVECEGPEDCNGYSCVNFKCQECQTSEDCYGDNVCMDNKCVKGNCSFNKDCNFDPEKPVCNINENTCVECVHNADCKQDGVCIDNRCQSLKIIVPVLLVLLGLGLLIVLLVFL